jgi:hypothetical protein
VDQQPAVDIHEEEEAAARAARRRGCVTNGLTSTSPIQRSFGPFRFETFERPKSDTLERLAKPVRDFTGSGEPLCT